MGLGGHTALLAHPDLPLQARQAHLFPWLTKALLFIGTLCEHGCEATFNDKSVHIKNNQSGKTTMRGKRDTRTKLYMLSLTHQNKLMTESTTPDEYSAGSAYKCKSTSTLVDYHHASCWIPTNSGQGKVTSSLIGQAYHWTWFTKTSQKTINHTWAPPATAEEPQIHTRKSHASRPRSRARPVSSSHTVRKHQSCRLQDSGSFRENLYRPNTNKLGTT